MKVLTSLGRKFFNQQDIRKLQIHLKEINSIVNRLNKTIELELKECKLDQNKKEKYKDFLAHVYMTFDKKIVSSKVDREMNKYKKMRIDVINYIVAHENQIIKQLSK